jgi:hypothetical protein
MSSATRMLKNSVRFIVYFLLIADSRPLQAGVYGLGSEKIHP